MEPIIAKDRPTALAPIHREQIYRENFPIIVKGEVLILEQKESPERMLERAANSIIIHFKDEDKILEYCDRAIENEKGSSHYVKIKDMIEDQLEKRN